MIALKYTKKACPLFVPLVEEGQEWWENDITYNIAKEYLAPLKQTGVDTLVLGCTHYPLLKNTISKVMGEGVTLVSSAFEVARVVKRIISDKNMQRDPRLTPTYHYYTSDSVENLNLCAVQYSGELSIRQRRWILRNTDEWVAGFRSCFEQQSDMRYFSQERCVLLWTKML